MINFRKATKNFWIHFQKLIDYIMILVKSRQIAKKNQFWSIIRYFNPYYSIYIEIDFLIPISN